MALVVKLFNFLYRTSQINVTAQQVRHKFTDWRMVKDYNKRQEVKKYGKEKLRLNALRKNAVLPVELRQIADKEIAELPRKSGISQLRRRCVITSRSKGCVRAFRLSRLVFRHLADGNKLSGVQRATW